jgi:hypothetical protein
MSDDRTHLIRLADAAACGLRPEQRFDFPRKPTAQFQCESH